MNKHEFKKHKILCLGLFDQKNDLKKYPNIYFYPYIYRKVYGYDKYKKN